MLLFCKAIGTKHDHSSDSLNFKRIGQEALLEHWALSKVDKNINFSAIRYDSRLTFKDLNHNSRLNVISQDVLMSMWVPHLQFTNALGPYQTSVDELSVATINLENPPTYDDIASSNECKPGPNIH